jgi:8-oxo-dGTP pyrophosphatase MutT (NUDIX family)
VTSWAEAEGRAVSVDRDRRWRRIGARELWRGGPQERLRLVEDAVIQPDGVESVYPHLVTPDSVRVLAVVGDRVALVRQDIYLSGVAVEAAGGIVDDGESAEEAAVRELAEETGLQASGPLIGLGEVVTARSYTTERCTLWLAREPRQGTAAPEPAEAGLAAVWVPVARAVAMAVDGEIHDAASVAALLRSHARGLLPERQR